MNNSFEDFMQLCEIAANEGNDSNWVISKLSFMNNAEEQDMMRKLAEHWIGRYTCEAVK